MPKVAQEDFQGDPNIGLFAKASDKLCLAGNVVSEKKMDKVKSILNVPMVNVSISATDFCGIFLAMNSNGILIPKIVYDKEKARLKSVGKKFDLDVEVLSSKYTAIGNLVLCNDEGAVISRLLSKSDKTKIEDCLDVEVAASTIASISTVGSTSIATNRGCLLHRDAEESEISLVKDLLKVDVGIGTANFGSPFVGSCVVANSNGCIAGLSTTGYEITRIMEALKFL